LFTQKIYAKEETFRISSSSTLEEDHETPTRVKTRDEHDSKWPEDRSVNMKIFRDSTRKRRSLDSKIQALTVKKMTSKVHMQVHTNKESREKQLGRKPGSNQDKTGLGRPA
jgi:hypothetical protein